ncbi:DNA repair protein Rev1 [Uranotaenia lowii]|uniref:DNA repair protein Rev1 n=1 Tax=Uranotaenia lowii TaxID=190385 RepID=UPI00247A5D2C|nr:DNA repair protein Rev1 [Uranotaenia lowii]
MKRKDKFESETGFEGWGDYMGAKISKLEDQFRHSAAALSERLSNLFEGISVFVNGYTKPSADELKRMMMQHGGIFHHYKRPTTTYIIASNLPDVKVKSITSEIIISPQWVVDCVEQKRLLDYKKYLLYTNQKASQPKLAFGKLDRNVDIQKPVTKPDNDISNDDYKNLMSKLHILNEQIKESGGIDTQKKNEVPKHANDSGGIENVTTNTQNLEQVQQEPVAKSPEIYNEGESGEASQSNVAPSSNLTVVPNAQPKVSPQRSLNATDPNFLTEFFNKSRLHHIATLGAGFKQYISELRETHDGTFPDRDNLRSLKTSSDEFGSTGPFVMHIDMDCFFVSVGLLKYPHLRGQPVAVTHSKGSDAGKVQSRPGQNRSLEIELYQKRLEDRYKTPDIPYQSRLLNIDDNNSMSEIASCSYEARKAGVKNGMFVGSALKLCPKLKTIPYDFEGYREVAFTLYNTIAKYTLNIEAVSCDEMFVDLSDLISSAGIDVMDFVSFVRDEIKSQTGCPCSAGVGANRLQARMATKKAKPDGQFYLSPESVVEYMRDVPIGDLPGVGPSTTYRLKQLSWNTCGDLQRVSTFILQREFGKKFGDTIYHACRGIDERPLVYEQVRKSVSVDVNYGIRFKDNVEVETFMKQLAAEIHKRLVEIKRRGKLITVKLLIRSPNAPVETAKYMGHGLCDVVTKSCPLADFTNDLEVIEKTILSLMNHVAAPAHELRGIGLQISKLEDKKCVAEPKNSLKSMFQKVEARKEIFKEADVSNEILSKPPTTELKNSLKTMFEKVEARKEIFKETAVLYNTSTEAPTEPVTDVPQTTTDTTAQEKEETLPILIPSNLPLASPNKNQMSKLQVTPTKIVTISVPNPPTAPSTPKKQDVSKKPGPRVGRGRGRPPKSLTMNKSKQTINITHYLKERQVEPKKKEPEIPAGLDPEVLAALPDDIRHEVINDYKLQNKSNNQKSEVPSKRVPSPQPSTSTAHLSVENSCSSKRANNMPEKINVDLKFLEALPPDLRQEVEKQIEMQRETMIITSDEPEFSETLQVTPESSPVKEIPANVQNGGPKVPPRCRLQEPESDESDQQPDNILLRLEWRNMLRSWLNSTEEPQPVDIELIGVNAQELIEQKKLNEIYLCLRFLFRVIEERGLCAWHQAYFRIVHAAQIRMREIYGTKLVVRDGFGCGGPGCCNIAL